MSYPCPIFIITCTKLSEITEDQVDLFNLAVLDMRDMLSEQS